MIENSITNCLPEEILLQIVDFLPADDTLRLSEVCQGFFKVCQSPLLDPSRSRPLSSRLTQLHSIIKDVIKDNPLRIELFDNVEVFGRFHNIYLGTPSFIQNKPPFVEFEMLVDIELCKDGSLKRRRVWERNISPKLSILTEMERRVLKIGSETVYGSSVPKQRLCFNIDEKHYYRVEVYLCKGENGIICDGYEAKSIQRLVSVANNLLNNQYIKFNYSYMLAEDRNSIEVLWKEIVEQKQSKFLEGPKKNSNKKQCSIQ